MISPIGPKGRKKESPLTTVLRALQGMSRPCGQSHGFYLHSGDTGMRSLALGRKETSRP